MSVRWGPFDAPWVEFPSQTWWGHKIMHLGGFKVACPLAFCRLPDLQGLTADCGVFVHFTKAKC